MNHISVQKEAKRGKRERERNEEIRDIKLSVSAQSFMIDNVKLIP